MNKLNYNIHFTLIILFVIISIAASAQQFSWATGAKGQDYDIANDLVVDINGKQSFCGYFISSYIVIGSSTIYNSGGLDSYGNPCFDAFVAKYDSNSTLIFAKKYGDSCSMESALGIAADKNDNLYVTGWFTGNSFCLGDDTLSSSGSWDCFIMKLDNSGNVLWAKKAGGSSDDIATAINIDNSGNVVITGYYWSSSIQFGSTVLTNSGSCDAFITKFDSDGNVLWAKKVSGGGIDLGKDIAFDDSDNIYLTGQFSSSNLSFGNHSLSTSGNSDIFTAKYSPSGTDLWAVKGGGTKMDHSYDIDCYKNSGCAITGAFTSSTATFGTQVLTNSEVNYFDIYIVMYDTAGNVLWAKNAGIDVDDIGRGVSFDTAGNLYAVGEFTSTSLTFDTFSITNTDASNTFSDVYIASFKYDGTVRWLKKIAALYNEQGNAIDNDIYGNTFITGIFESYTIYLDSLQLTTTGNADIFVAKIDAAIVIADTTTPEPPPPGPGIVENSNNNISVFPNPAHEFINISTGIFPVKSIIIHDITGRELLIIDDINQNNIEIPISKLPTGILILKVIYSENNTARIKIIHQ